MKKLSEMTLQELQQHLVEVNAEIAAREAAGNGFDAEFEKGGKSYKQASKSQVNYIWDLAKKTNSVIDCSSTALYTKFTPDVISEMIALMKEGKRIHIF